VDGKPVGELATPQAQPAPELAAECEDPVPLGDAAMSAGETERGWGHDRKSLADCKSRHKQLRDFYQNRDSKLALTANSKQ
jgi:hypothetical protein